VPVSTSLQRADLRPLNYDGALELLSRPFMQQYSSAWSFGESRKGEDGVAYTLKFERYADANHAWRYLDLTRQVTFLSGALEETIEREMRGEALYLQQHGRARARLKTIIEGPDSTGSNHSIHPVVSEIHLEMCTVEVDGRTKRRGDNHAMVCGTIAILKLAARRRRSRKGA